jgi:hypothetical protein
MSKLLLYVDDEQVDQILMVVPDNYDKEVADEEARNFLSGDAYLKESWDTGKDDTMHYSTGEYRAYVG